MGTSVSLAKPAPPQARDPAWPGSKGDANRIKLSWLIRLQWGGIIGQTLTILAARYILHIDLSLVAMLGLVAFEVVANIGLEGWLRQADRVPQPVIAGAMCFDALLMTALLALSGGPANPFSTMYLVNVALSTVLLDAAWAWAMLAVSLALFALLFALAHVGALQVLSAVDQQEIVALHLQGMWVSLVLAAAFIVYIVGRVQLALTRVEEALAEERSLSARKDKVASLATLAAGAAHELSTPLSTIAVVAKELQLSAIRNKAPEAALQDLALMREQVARCRDILHHMSAQAGENAGEPFVVMSLARWLESTLEHLPDHTRVVVEAGLDLQASAVAGPPRGLARALRGLLKNALQASPPDAEVLLRLSRQGGQVRAEVVDRGSGMEGSILSRAGEPFFTTKVPGEGMGLGLFLTQTLADQLGGQLELVSRPGRGTTATLSLPLSNESRSDAR
ncbi:MAG TPA: ATP-binding protein [Anaeromyxobacteraceae bacterium]|nr:ATP-binding protein [Anaeromyxobacteraceae bacterium]